MPSTLSQPSVSLPADFRRSLEAQSPASPLRYHTIFHYKMSCRYQFNVGGTIGYSTSYSFIGGGTVSRAVLRTSQPPARIRCSAEMDGLSRPYVLCPRWIPCDLRQSFKCYFPSLRLLLQGSGIHAGRGTSGRPVNNHCQTI